MNPMVYLGIASLAVTLVAFLIGRASASGGVAADVVTLKSRVDTLQATATANQQRLAALEQAGKGDESMLDANQRHGEEIAALKVQIGALDRALDERYDSTRKAHARLDQIDRRLTRQETTCEQSLGRCNTARHIIEPGQGQGGGDSENGGGGT